MRVRTLIKSLARRVGFDIVRFDARNSPVARRMELFRYHGVDLILDVGASDGGFGREVRRTAYTGRLVSFEPLSAAFAVLEGRAKADGRWEAKPYGLGNAAGSLEINVARNSGSSSLLDMLPRHVEAYPYSEFVGSESVTIRRLDDVFADCRQAGETTYLKIDTQGYERHVLEGAERSLADIVGVQLELSLVPLYDGEPRFTAMIDYLEKRGFTLMSLQPVIEDPRTGQLLQVDGLFFRT